MIDWKKEIARRMEVKLIDLPTNPIIHPYHLNLNIFKFKIPKEIIYEDGTKSSYRSMYKKPHCVTGPAITYEDGSAEYYYHGKKLNISSEEEKEFYIRNSELFVKFI